MAHTFQRHYTREEARALLPLIRVWLREIRKRRELVGKTETRYAPRLAAGEDLGGANVNEWLRRLAEMQQLLQQFAGREIQIKDLDRGLIDFPALINDREVFLCWEEGEDDIEYWHDLETGYPGRERL